MRVAIFIIALILICNLDICGQVSETGTLVGTVTDPSGAVIPNADIMVTSHTTSAKFLTTTDEDGEFILLLRSDTYRVIVEANGFAKLTLDQVKISTQARVSLKVKLEIAGVAVTVSGDAATIYTSENINAIISATVISDVPINSRRFVDFVALTPGVTFSGSDEIVLLSALRGITGSTIVDGQDNNAAFFGGQRNTPDISLEAIGEFQVFTNNFSSEFGRSTGGIINADTKSGTNEFHGGALFDIRDNKLQAKGPFGGTSKPSFDREYFGGSLGGPIKEDTAFFYVSIEQQRERGATTVGSRDLIRREIVQDFSKTWQNKTLLSAKLDFNVNNNSFTGKYFFDFDNALTPGFSFDGKLQAPDNFQYQKQKAHEIDFKWAWGNSRLVNEFSIGSSYTKRQNAPVSTQPQIVYPSLNSGANFLADQNRTLFNVYLSDKFSTYFGKHSLKTGYNYSYSGVQTPTSFNIFGTGIIFVPCNFPGELGCQGITNDANIPVTLALINQQTLTDGFIGFGKRGLIPAIKNNSFSTYVQDDYRLISDFTLGLGIRWDYDSNPSGVNQVNQYRPGRRKHQKNKVSPRISISWILKRITIRGGHGYYFAQTNLDIRSLELLADGVNLLITRATSTTLSNPFAATSNNLLPQMFVTSNNFKSPYFRMSSASGEIELGKSLYLNTSFTSTRGKRFPRRFEANIRKDGSRLDNNFGSVIETQAVGHYENDNLTIMFVRRYFNKWQLHASYALSRAIDDDYEPLSIVNSVSNPLNPEIDRGAAAYTPKHEFKFFGIVKLPWDFNLSSIIQASSSLPFEIVQNHDFSGAIHSGFFRLPVLPRNAGNRQIRTGADLNKFIDAFNANPAFVQEHGGPINRVDPNIKFDNPFFKVDLSLSKIIRFTENIQLQIKLDIFNLLNRTNIGGLSSFNSSGLGNNLERSNFGKPLGVLPGGFFGNYAPRSFQIGAKFTF